MKTWTIAALLLLSLGCDDQGLPPDDTLKPAVTVQFLEASCTEVWLRLAPRNVSPPYTLTLLRNDSAVATLSSPPADTTVIDEGLAPSRTYTYRARLTSPSGLNLTGDPVQARTLDTTSHQFTWETTVLGDGGSSIFYDVAIVNDTLAYAVGEVYLRDSSGVLDPNAYNLAKWNGRRWQLLRIQFYTICGQQSRTPYPASALFAFSETNIWISSRGGQVAQWNGTAQTATLCMPDPFVITRLWGLAPNSLWAVGYGGGIAHFDGSTWRRVESGTALTIRDIWGAADTFGNGHQILVLASGDGGQAQVASILEIHGTSAVAVNAQGLSRALGGIWFVSGRRYYAVGAGIFQIRQLSDPSWTGYPPGVVTRFASSAVRGLQVNDAVVVGSFGEVVHFNGISWQRYFSDVPLPNGVYASVAIRGNQIFAVGTLSPGRAVVLRGTRGE